MDCNRKVRILNFLISKQIIKTNVATCFKGPNCVLVSDVVSIIKDSLPQIFLNFCYIKYVCMRSKFPKIQVETSYKRMNNLQKACVQLRIKSETLQLKMQEPFRTSNRIPRPCIETIKVNNLAMLFSFSLFNLTM